MSHLGQCTGLKKKLPWDDQARAPAVVKARACLHQWQFQKSCNALNLIEFLHQRARVRAPARSKAQAGLPQQKLLDESSYLEVYTSGKQAPMRRPTPEPQGVLQPNHTHIVQEPNGNWSNRPEAQTPTRAESPSTPSLRTVTHILQWMELEWKQSCRGKGLSTS